MNTTEPRLLRVEIVADLPVWWAPSQRRDLVATLDRHCPAPAHGRGPLRPGKVRALWLLFRVAPGDHCRNHVAPGVAQHQGARAARLGTTVRPVHAHDDRRADGLTRLGQGTAFSARQRDRNQQTIRVYPLPTDRVRSDTTTADS